MIAVLLLTAVALFVGHQFNQQALKAEVSNYLLTYFLNTLEEPMFSDETGVINDSDSILNAGTKINNALLNIIGNRWYSGIDNCRATVFTVDGEQIVPKQDSAVTLTLLVPRNKINRPVEYGIDCQYRLEVYTAWFAAIGLVFYAVFLFLPYPLTPNQYEWMNHLIQQGYERREAYECCNDSRVDKLSLTDLQLKSFNCLHDPKTKNFAAAVKLIDDIRIKNLKDRQVEWLAFAMRHFDKDVTKALSLALAADTVEIDLSRSLLKIHGINIDINKTPLFYYAWYAHNRQTSDGWITNPQSNIPDHQAGMQLAKLMLQFSGHAKAIYDLEKYGLKSKTLDQNRSKIKDILVSVLGDKLAEGYLFDVRKDPKTNRMSYRLRLDPEQINILTWPRSVTSSSKFLISHDEQKQQRNIAARN